MTPEELVKEYTDKSKPFPLPSLEGMYVHPRYVIHQHDLQELIDALRRLIRERDEARAELAENEAVIAVWRGRTERAEKERDENKRAFDEVSKQLGILMTIRDRQYEEAESEGYRKGVEDALGKVEASLAHIDSPELHADILALLEQKPR